MYRVDRFGDPQDWNEAAVDAAERIAAHLSRVDRGAVPWWDREYSIVFGRSGDQVPPEVHLLRRRLVDLDIKEMGFGLSPDRQTWAMIAGSPDTTKLAFEVVDAWRIAQSTGSDDPLRKTLQTAGAMTSRRGCNDDAYDEHPEVAD